MFSSLSFWGWWDFPGGSANKESTCNAGDLGLNPGLGKAPRVKEWSPTPLFWLGEFHGLYCPWGRKESDMTENCVTHPSLGKYFIVCRALVWKGNIELKLKPSSELPQVQSFILSDEAMWHLPDWAIFSVFWTWWIHESGWNRSPLLPKGNLHALWFPLWRVKNLYCLKLKKFVLPFLVALFSPLSFLC